MPVNHVDFIDTRLAAPLKSTDVQVKLQHTRGLLDKLNRIPIGDYVYLIISLHSIMEVVKYTHTAPIIPASVITLSVERGQHNTVATSFSVGSCVYSQITKAFLDEWLTQNNCCAEMFPLSAKGVLNLHIPAITEEVCADDNCTNMITEVIRPEVRADIPIQITIDSGGVIIHSHDTGGA